VLGLQLGRSGPRILPGYAAAIALETGPRSGSSRAKHPAPTTAPTRQSLGYWTPAPMRPTASNTPNPSAAQPKVRRAVRRAAIPAPDGEVIAEQARVHRLGEQRPDVQDEERSGPVVKVTEGEVQQQGPNRGRDPDEELCSPFRGV